MGVFFDKDENDFVLEQAAQTPSFQKTGLFESLEATRFLAFEDSFGVSAALSARQRRIAEEARLADEEFGVDPLIGVNELNQRYSDRVDRPFTKPMRAREVDFILAQADDRRQLQRKVAEGPQGLFYSGLHLGAGILSHATDPVEIAAGLLTDGMANAVLRGTRIGRSVGFGVGVKKITAAQAARRGTIQGFVGNAAIEPLVFLQKKEVLEDYTVEDAMFNVVAGAVGFGVIRYTGGRLATYMRGRSPGFSDFMINNNTARLLGDKRPNNDLAFRAVAIEGNSKGFDAKINRAYTYIQKNSQEVLDAPLYAGVRMNGEHVAIHETLGTPDTSIHMSDRGGQASASVHSIFDKGNAGNVVEYGVRPGQKVNLLDLNEKLPDNIIKQIEKLGVKNLDKNAIGIDNIRDIQDKIALGELDESILNSINKVMKKNNIDGYHHRGGDIFGQPQANANITVFFDGSKLEPKNKWGTDSTLNDTLTKAETDKVLNSYDKPESDLFHSKDAELQAKDFEARGDEATIETTIESLKAENVELKKAIANIETDEVHAKLFRDEANRINKAEAEDLTLNSIREETIECLSGGGV